MRLITLILTICLTGLADSPSPEKQRAMASEIDSLIQKKLVEKNIQQEAPVSDEVFLRRIYLDVVGRIPTLNEAKDFLDSNDKNKRDNLIDRLLDSKGYTSHNFNYWADTLRATTRMRNVSGNNYQAFIKKFISDDKPYDEFVKELLKANGAAYEHGNGATGYYLRDTNMPLDNLSNTMQIFLGTSMVCAQCHDHPFDKWTQLDFYKLAAFTAGTKTKVYFNKKDPQLRELYEFRKEISDDRDKSNTLKQITDVKFAGVNHNGTGLIRLPYNYDYDDAKPNEIIKAETPYGPKVSLNYPAPKEVKKSSKKRRLKSPTLNAKCQRLEKILTPEKLLLNGSLPGITRCSPRSSSTECGRKYLEHPSLVQS